MITKMMIKREMMMMMIKDDQKKKKDLKKNLLINCDCKNLDSDYHQWDYFRNLDQS